MNDSKLASKTEDPLLPKKLYATVYRIRSFEKKCAVLYRQGLINGYLHSYIGEEAIAAGACAAMRSGDYIVSTHRGHGHCIANGADIKAMMAEICGKETGYCQGRGGSMHIADFNLGNLGANGIVGGGIPMGVGAALGAKIRGTTQAVIIFLSDGASNNGVFPESLNLAAIWNLPVVFLIENNGYAVSTPIEQTSRTADLFRRASGYLVSSGQIDGNDAAAVYEAVQSALEQCRNGQGPALVEAKTYRHGGHHVNDPGAYMPREKLEYFKAQDPVTTMRNKLLQSPYPEEKIRDIEKHIEAEIESAVEYVKNSPEPSVEKFLEVCE